MRRDPIGRFARFVIHGVTHHRDEVRPHGAQGPLGGVEPRLHHGLLVLVVQALDVSDAKVVAADAPQRRHDDRRRQVRRDRAPAVLAIVLCRLVRLVWRFLIALDARLRARRRGRSRPSLGIPLDRFRCPLEETGPVADPVLAQTHHLAVAPREHSVLTALRVVHKRHVKGLIEEARVNERVLLR